MANETKTAKSVFATLSAIDCGEHIEKKRSGQTELSYLSWAWAWHYIKANYPDASYTIYERPDGIPYWTDGRTCWVKTGVTINGAEHIEYLPIMDYRNQSIPVDKVTSMDMNKAIQRSLTKAAARHGLGLYIYAGEDLPLSEEEAQQQEAEQKRAPRKAAPKEQPTAKLFDVAKLPKEKYDQWVMGAATGRRTKNGDDCRTGFVKTFAPNETQLAQFDKDVFAYQLANNIQPEGAAANA